MNRAWIKEYKHDFDTVTVTSTASTYSDKSHLNDIKERVKNEYCQHYLIKGTCRYGDRCWRIHYGQKKREVVKKIAAGLEGGKEETKETKEVPLRVFSEPKTWAPKFSRPAETTRTVWDNLAAVASLSKV